MSTLMSWNIQRFAQSKLLPNRFDRNQLREWDIISTIQESGADLFAVIEVQTGWGGGLGSLITPGAGQGGVTQLLLALRVNLNAGWQVVPPLVLTPNNGYSEGIAIFFNSATFEFCGPLLWTGAAAGPVGGGGGVQYPPAQWGVSLPNGANHLGIAQDTMAGQCVFLDAAGNQVFFPNNNCRSIWWTQFFDMAANRTLNLFTVHFPPNRATAGLAFAEFANVPEITGALAANEDRVIWGDFNINALNPAEAAAFQVLTGGPVPAGFPQYAGQINLPTNLRGVRRATTRGANPYYRYVKRNAGGFVNLDNIFVARQGAAAAPANQNIANRTVGGGPFSIDMVTNIPAINGGLPAGGARARSFRNPVNFGHIGGGRGVSDHMAVVVGLP